MPVQRRRTHTAYAGGKRHGRPWGWGRGLASPFLALPSSSPVSQLLNQGGVGVRSEASPEPFTLDPGRVRGPRMWMETRSAKGSVSRTRPGSTHLCLRSVQVPSPSTCRVWLLSQSETWGGRRMRACPSQGHSQKQYVCPSGKLKCQVQGNLCLERRPVRLLFLKCIMS